MRYVIHVCYNSNCSRKLLHFSNKREKNLRNTMPYIIIITELCTYKYGMIFVYMRKNITYQKKNQTKKPNQKTKRKFIVLNTFAIENTNYMLRNFKPLINCLNNN